MRMRGILYCSAATVGLIQGLMFLQLFTRPFSLGVWLCLTVVETMNGAIVGSAIARLGQGER